MERIRYPNETIIFMVTFLLLAAILIITAIPTLFIGPILAVAAIVFSYIQSSSMHQQLIHTAYPVNEQTSPELLRILRETQQRLKVKDVSLYVVPSRVRNAYTFGLNKPQAVVLYSPLLEILDADELRFVIGHELGHVALDHTWLNTLLGGMSGIPTSFGLAMLITLVFRSWNRACEYSVDRAGLIACGNLNKAITALVQIAVGDIRSQSEFQRALAMIDSQDNSWVNILGEGLSTHPMIIRRIQKLKEFASSSIYREMTA